MGTSGENDLASRFPGRVSSWHLRTQRLELPPRPRLMGIVNVTPDSFSDGGQFFDTSAAIDRALRLADEGADLIDIGGESTRPNSEPISEAEELRRVIPVIRAVCEQGQTPVSIDTSKAAVAREAISAGAELINDVTALTGDPAMIDVALETKTGICAMHMQGTPRTMQDAPAYNDVVEDIFEYMRARRDELLEAGISKDRLALDPGIGFGKTHQHNLTLLAACHRFHELGCPLLLGYSRKGFIGKLLGDKGADRTAAGIGIAVALANQGVQILRVHDLRPVRESLEFYEAVGGLGGSRAELT